MGWGLVVDIQVPDIETKIAILKKKSELHHILLSQEVAEFIASRVVSNIRELEGSLVRISAFSSLTNQPITLDLAKRVLLHLPQEKNEGVMLNKVLKAVAKHYAVSLQDLRSKKRNKNIATVRQVAFFLMKKHSFCSLQTIGDFIGGRDHSTVIHAVGKVEELKEKDASFAQKLKIVEQDLLSY
jgi:chromosomal replication initiator protein